MPDCLEIIKAVNSPHYTKHYNVGLTDWFFLLYNGDQESGNYDV